jgi:hypothetical protein
VIGALAQYEARVDEGFLTISARCHEDIRDQIRAVGAIDESIAVELIGLYQPHPAGPRGAGE